jgi:hypothetical protein
MQEGVFLNEIINYDSDLGILMLKNPNSHADRMASK